MSVKQLLQAEKKIRCFSLLQEQFQLPLCANGMMLLLTMETFQLLVTKNICVNCFVFIVVCMDDITESDATVCYFVSWYIARSVARRRRCSCCKNMLIERNEISMIAIPEQYTELYNIADRGGMSAPTEICFWYRCNWNAVLHK